MRRGFWVHRLVDDLPHAIAAQQFRSPLGRRARRQDGKAAHVRCHHQRLDRDGFIDQRIRETRRLLQTEYFADVRLEQIRIDEQHRDVPFPRQTEREIDAGERLAVARQGTRHHDEAWIGGGAGIVRQCFLDERTLDVPIVIGKLAILLLLGQITARAQGIDLHGQSFGACAAPLDGLARKVPRCPAAAGRRFSRAPRRPGGAFGTWLARRGSRVHQGVQGPQGQPDPRPVQAERNRERDDKTQGGCGKAP